MTDFNETLDKYNGQDKIDLNNRKLNRLMRIGIHIIHQWEARHHCCRAWYYVAERGHDIHFIIQIYHFECINHYQTYISSSRS